MLQVRSCASGRASAPCDTDWPPDASALFSCSCAAQEVAVDPRDLDVGKEIGIAASLPRCLAAAFVLAMHCLHTQWKLLLSCPRANPGAAGVG